MTKGSADADIIKSLAVAAAPAKVWRVLTEPALIARWMTDELLTVEADWRPGGRIRFAGRLHGQAFENRGRIIAFSPPTLFEYAFWSTLSATRLAETAENLSRVRFLVEPEAAGARLTLTLRDFPEPSMRPHAALFWGATIGIIRDVAELDEP
jgi:uncharacterized protein YndB with AHSA1/START domain